ncbi:MAG: HypC/HybG/HupF family hydrogenase formation chaperone [Clostridia bacterium]|nr:HypC/HybG/HupF family hydrogenase formation chaperone [Clostridia bacterium]
MCLAIPGKVINIEDNIGTVEVSGVTRKVSFDLTPDVKVGDYVLVHAGFAIEVIDEEEALKTLEIFKELAEHEIH